MFSVRNKNIDLQIFEAMKEFILRKIPVGVWKPDPDTLEFGPGHGLKSRLYNDDDVKGYNCYQFKVLSCFKKQPGE